MATDAATLASYEAARDQVLANGYAVTADGIEWKRDSLEVLERMIDKYRSRATSAARSPFDRCLIGVPYRG